jgi:hypothetical protein
MKILPVACDFEYSHSNAKLQHVNSLIWRIVNGGERKHGKVGTVEELVSSSADKEFPKKNGITNDATCELKLYFWKPNTINKTARRL